MKNGIAAKTNMFFSGTELDSATTVVLRMDGVVLYSNVANATHIGALVAGSWQALKQLSSVVLPDNGCEFRLGFDTTSSGVYVLPFKIGQEEYYFAVLYKDVVNPAQLKNRARILVKSLCKFLLESECDLEEIDHCEVKEKKVDSLAQKVEDERKSYLFNEITDDEMNQLFSTVGC